jgi:hypothetical protein
LSDVCWVNVHSCIRGPGSSCKAFILLDTRMQYYLNLILSRCACFVPGLLKHLAVYLIDSWSNLQLLIQTYSLVTSNKFVGLFRGNINIRRCLAGLYVRAPNLLVGRSHTLYIVLRGQGGEAKTVPTVSMADPSNHVALHAGCLHNFHESWRLTGQAPRVVRQAASRAGRRKQKQAQLVRAVAEAVALQAQDAWVEKTLRTLDRQRTPSK